MKHSGTIPFDWYAWRRRMLHRSDPTRSSLPNSLRTSNGPDRCTERLRVWPLLALNIAADAMSKTTCGSIYRRQHLRSLFQDQDRLASAEFGNNLANLINSDRKAIKIALTGTPLLREVAKEFDSKSETSVRSQSTRYPTGYLGGLERRFHQVRKNLGSSWSRDSRWPIILLLWRR